MCFHWIEYPHLMSLVWEIWATALKKGIKAFDELYNDLSSGSYGEFQSTQYNLTLLLTFSSNKVSEVFSKSKKPAHF